jgi:hypothetical protein
MAKERITKGREGNKRNEKILYEIVWTKYPVVKLPYTNMYNYPKHEFTFFFIYFFNELPLSRS